jgi:hypothetical protein
VPTCKRENVCHVQNDQVFCFSDEWSRKKRRGAWNTRSPKIEAMRLNSGVNAFWVPVLYGEPKVTSWGYSVRTSSIWESVILMKKNSDKYSRSSASALRRCCGQYIV